MVPSGRLQGAGHITVKIHRAGEPLMSGVDPGAPVVRGSALVPYHSQIGAGSQSPTKTHRCNGTERRIDLQAARHVLRIPSGQGQDFPPVRLLPPDFSAVPFFRSARTRTAGVAGEAWEPMKCESAPWLVRLLAGLSTPLANDRSFAIREELASRAGKGMHEVAMTALPDAAIEKGREGGLPGRTGTEGSSAQGQSDPGPTDQ